MLRFQHAVARAAIYAMAVLVSACGVSMRGVDGVKPVQDATPIVASRAQDLPDSVLAAYTSYADLAFVGHITKIWSGRGIVCPTFGIYTDNPIRCNFVIMQVDSSLHGTPPYKENLRTSQNSVMWRSNEHLKENQFIALMLSTDNTSENEETTEKSQAALDGQPLAFVNITKANLSETAFYQMRYNPALPTIYCMAQIGCERFTIGVYWMEFSLDRIPLTRQMWDRISKTIMPAALELKKTHKRKKLLGIF